MTCSGAILIVHQRENLVNQLKRSSLMLHNVLQHTSKTSGRRMADSDRVLCVGIVVVDIITEVFSFPCEDIKTRCGPIYERVGGNAASNCRVLSLLGEKASFMGCAGTVDQHLRLVEEFFTHYGVDMTPLVKCDGYPMPLTICILNKTTGTRTCLHHRGSLPELSLNMFVDTALSLSSYKWIHFEGRYDSEPTLSQIQHVDELRKTEGYKFIISVELEKASKPLIPLLSSQADYAFISKDFAKVMGYADMAGAAQGLSDGAGEGLTVICPWGESGAAAQAKYGQVVTAAAHPPEEIVNTLGAGDTFIAACIKALLHGTDLQKSLNYACRVAGTKCGLKDLDELRDMDIAL